MTIEDPVENQIAGHQPDRGQRQRGLTFASGLRTILRSDPDVLLVGEIRDEETARIAIQAAMTGHLVLDDAAHPQRRQRRSRGSRTWASTESCSRPRSTASSRSGSRAGSASTAARPYAPTQAETSPTGARRPPEGEMLYRAARLRRVRRHRLLRPRRPLRGDAVSGKIRQLIEALDRGDLRRCGRQGMTTLRDDGMRLASRASRRSRRSAASPATA